MKINVLGTEYTIRWVDYGEDEYIKKWVSAVIVVQRKKEIVLVRLNTVDGCEDELEEVIQRAQKTTLRREIIHAFFNESGLRQCSSTADKWAQNEEMVDWIAIQFPKLLEAFKAADAL